MKWWTTLGLDLAWVLIFAVIGRLSHGEAADPFGVAVTAWPNARGDRQMFPGEADLGHEWASHPQLPAGCRNQPGPAVGCVGVAPRIDVVPKALPLARAGDYSRSAQTVQREI